MEWNITILDIFNDSNSKKLLLDGSWGIECEGQRINEDGSLALTPHPEVFGDKLTHPSITTDFAESQLELVTPPSTSIEGAYNSLSDIFVQVRQGLGKELLWPLSMPPKLPEESEIPIAYFGETPEGKAKELYRQGLADRYGKKMQMISGVHYNYSLGNNLLDFLYTNLNDKSKEKTKEKIDKRLFTEQLYLAIVRNFLRYRWMLIYLYGASPNFDESYHSVICKELEKIKIFHPKCFEKVKNFERYATSLRVSRYGYFNSEQQDVKILFNDLEYYIKLINKMVDRKVIQNEMEFYSPIRLKPTFVAGKKQLDLLSENGISYLEVRTLDLNPFASVGITLEQLKFMQVFMLYCLVAGNDKLSDTELALTNDNHHLVAMAGRKPGLKLKKIKKLKAVKNTISSTVELHDNIVSTDGYDNLSADKNGDVLNEEYYEVPIDDYACEIFDQLIQVAIKLDNVDGGRQYQTIIENERAKIANKDLLLSANIYNEMHEKGESFAEFGLRYAKKHSAHKE